MEMNQDGPVNLSQQGEEAVDEWRKRAATSL